MPTSIRPSRRIDLFEILGLYSKLVEFDSTEDQTLSSHWQKFYTYIKIELLYKSNKPVFEVEEWGLAEIKTITISSLLLNLKVVILNFYLLIKFKCSLKIIWAVCTISIKTNRLINFDMVKHAILLSKVKNYITHSKFVVVGDGFGFLGTLLKRLYPRSEIIFINLPKNLFLDFLFFTKAISLTEQNLGSPSNPILVKAADLNSLEIGNALFFNVASFSEMKPNQIDSYLSLIKNSESTLITLNRNAKVHPDGSVIELEKFYIKYFTSIEFEENPCNFYQKYPSGGFKTFFCPFDGDFHLKVMRF